MARALEALCPTLFVAPSLIVALFMFLALVGALPRIVVLILEAPLRRRASANSSGSVWWRSGGCRSGGADWLPQRWSGPDAGPSRAVAP